ncbi:glycosyltransferase family 2 protein [Thiomicrorhabdus indica]|uniref:glycosyltransferase family 2 protein n=1 Tax=Thiomicrorhabdus indica TaxID=2267253 RepID=UPI002AA5F7BB|nr:glycosyltransferase family 2 protein [Thiomicrorhabdus indica]
MSIFKNTPYCIVVDNGSENILELKKLCSRLKVECISLKNNLGIAGAQNIGIKKAIEAGADYVWISDQDTIYPNDFLSTMLNELKGRQDSNNIAAIGPSFYDNLKGKRYPFERFTPWKKSLPISNETTEVSQLIASGMIIPAKAFKEIGLKNEALFIDWVDFEWCWRATFLGWKILGTGKIIIEHHLGDETVSFFGRTVTLRSPFRHYHMIRNGVYLALYSPYLKWQNRLEIFLISIRWLIAYPLLAKRDKMTHLNLCYKAFWHGLSAKLSSISE